MTNRNSKPDLHNIKFGENPLTFTQGIVRKLKIKKDVPTTDWHTHGWQTWNHNTPPLWGGSNEYPQSMFLSRNKKDNVYPCKPQFYYIRVGFKGVKLYRYVFVMYTFHIRYSYEHMTLWERETPWLDYTDTVLDLKQFDSYPPTQ